MTRDQRRHERYVRRMQRTRNLTDVHGFIDLARRVGIFLASIAFLAGVAFAGFYCGQVMHP